MTLWQTSKIVWSNIIRNRMRSFLTMLGMIIGVASVIILVSLMQSFRISILDSYAEMGIYNVSVTIKGRNGNMMITEQDIYRYANDHKESIKGVMPTVAMGGTLSKNGETIEWSDIKGIDENYTTILKKVVETGHSITYSDVASRQKVCVIGSYLNQRLFKGKAELGDTVRLAGEELTIVGILKETSNSYEWSSDNCLYMPYTTAMRLSGTGSVSSYEFYITDGTRVSAETEAMQKYLFNIFHDKKAYSVTNMADWQQSINQEMSLFTSMIAGIAGISLAVAGIGIMNIMLVSVSERTREIGITKSLGAKFKDILCQFVLEAGVTSTLGGLLGILLGSIITIKAGDLIKIKAMPSTNSIILSFAVSVGIGIIFGVLPAIKAAKLNPIEALRSE